MGTVRNRLNTVTTKDNDKWEPLEISSVEHCHNKTVYYKGITYIFAYIVRLDNMLGTFSASLNIPSIYELSFLVLFFPP